MALDRLTKNIAAVSSSNDTASGPEVSGGVARRRILVGAAGIGAFGVASSLLAACGGSGDNSTEPTTSRAPNDPLATTDQVPQGGGLILQDQKIVITQPDAGDFKAFTAVCTHQGCTVGSVQDNVITCPCHGSQYDAATGEVIQGPAPKALAAKDITVDGDQITLA